MYLRNRGAGKQSRTWSGFGPLHTIQAIYFVPNSTSVVGKLLMQILISSLSKVPGSFISFHIWVNCVVLPSSKPVLVEANTCKLVGAR